VSRQPLRLWVMNDYDTEESRVVGSDGSYYIYVYIYIHTYIHTVVRTASCLFFREGWCFRSFFFTRGVLHVFP